MIYEEPKLELVGLMDALCASGDFEDENTPDEGWLF